MNYEELLDRAVKNMPKKAARAERFEVPLVDSFMQGNKTIIKNFDFIASTLRRDPQMIARYLSKQLAIPVGVEGKQLILNGKFNFRMLNERIKTFVDSYVICKECKKPDTNIVEHERSIKLLICESCGARSPVKL
ncbi:MAG: translation initiation factor IF-2 subunit beta [Candidatus Micrarchaeota archaeon]